jgi:hypothetical protein
VFLLNFVKPKNENKLGDEKREVHSIFLDLALQNDKPN